LAAVQFVGQATLLPGAQEGEPARPKGEVSRYVFDQSKIFPGTVRNYWVYVPRQYDAAKPACLYVNQDGIQYKAPEVFDELIQKKEMPVVIGVFVTPGRAKALSPQALDRFNRSLEYDGLGDAYVRSNGRPGLRPGRASQLHHPRTGGLGLETLLGRRRVSVPLCNIRLRWPTPSPQAQGHRRAGIPAADQARRSKIVSSPDE
jgi:hypothetical protein